MAPQPASVVQRVTTTWTEATRGGPAATARSRLPIAFRLPSDAHWHDVTLDESRDFRPQEHSEAVIPTVSLGELDLDSSEGRARFLPRLDPTWMPRRHRRPPRQSVSPGHFVRWSVNYRQGFDDGWVYGLITWNVGVVTGRIDPTMFLVEPARLVDELGALR